MNIVFDIDGTICFDGESISPIILDKIYELSFKNRIFFASARHPRDISRLLPEKLKKNSILVGANGAICQKYDSVIYSRPMSINTVDNILSILDSYECSYLIDGVQCYYKSVKKHRFFKVITPFDNCSEKGVNELKEIGVLCRINLKMQA
ncbi:HAD family phosphatase [Vibrio campbellii]|uniref:HAD hydrolase family protein n=1 Tax=Vibrio campbellii TaxID=680 RepID=UPI00026C4EFE|nr:HAD hydrolase family protein [Vibrio campbellii]AXB34279.1 HAD family phosphatase [Vibrio campbellii]